jgi:catechol 2,3-dioxygenase-like lactoylglutathione lyase family enzyme
MSQQDGTAPGLEGLGHISLTVTDVDRSVEWYQRVLGLTKMMDEEHEGGHAVVLATPDFGVIVGLHHHESADGERFAETRTGLDHIAFNVANRAALESWIGRFDELGVDHGALKEAPYGALVAFRDPDNIQLEVISLGTA